MKIVSVTFGFESQDPAVDALARRNKL
jgi:hypothetical protein